jgi:5-methylcytosine-specific restriction enzyme A
MAKSRPKLTMLKPRVQPMPAQTRIATIGESGWRRSDATTAERGYGSRWQRARVRFLREHPLCAMCDAENPPRLTPACIVDHKVPHRGDQDLFWDESNWQSLCTTCHNSHKQRLERSGNAPRVIGEDGWPV